MKMLVEIHFPSGKSGNEEAVLEVFKEILHVCEGKALCTFYRENIYDL
jgi:hypothetical protein